MDKLLQKRKKYYLVTTLQYTSFLQNTHIAATTLG